MSPWFETLLWRLGAVRYVANHNDVETTAVWIYSHTRIWEDGQQSDVLVHRDWREVYGRYLRSFKGVLR